MRVYVNKISIIGVFDTNVLLDFALSDSLALLADVFEAAALVPRHIREVELAKGATRGFGDPCVIEGREWIEIVDLDTDEFQVAQDLELRLGPRHRGEAHAIAIAHGRNLAVFTRDGTALKWAQRMGVPGISTVGILNRIVRLQLRPYATIREVAEAMTEANRMIDIEFLRAPGAR
jgi:predicted nucleic acid-binding protein